MMEPQVVDLEDDSINFWASLGVNPHVDQMPLHNVQIVDYQAQPPLPAVAVQPQSVCKDLFPIESDPCLEPRLGMEFESGEAAKTFYIAYAGRIGFSVRIARSRKSKCSESIIMLRFVCSREGFSKEKRVVTGKKTRKQATSIREGCNAMLEVLRRGDSKWVVTKLVKEHNHEVGLPSRVHYIAIETDAAVDPYVGMEFKSLESAKTFYYSYASRVGFEARVRQSRKSQDDSLKMLKLVCSRHRYHSGRENNVEDIKSVHALDPSKDGCNALFEIIRKDKDVWMVSKLILEHCHELNPATASRVHCVRSQGEVLVIAKNFSDTRNLLLNGQDFQHPREMRYNDLGPEDAESLFEYLKKAQDEDPAFFYAVQRDKNGHTANIFWADAKARMAYYHFGDAVLFETRYRKNKENIPVVIFLGVNHHVQPVVFGCALLVDESEASFVWLFENWFETMHGGPPVSLLTEFNRGMAAAVAKVIPDTHHIFSENHILDTIKEELHGMSPELELFITDLRKCIECRIEESFESGWNSVIINHGFRNNELLQSLYDIRTQWAPVYTKMAFHPRNLLPQTCEHIEEVIEKYFSSKTQLRVAVWQLGQAISGSFETEAQADYLTMFQMPALCTASPVEIQGSSIFTSTIFGIFQEQFVQSFGYHAERLEDEMVHKYRVTGYEGDEEAHTVSFNPDLSTVNCSCCLFESCGILCRHALRIVIIEGVRALPKAYILKRWTKHAKNIIITLDNYIDLRAYRDDPSTARFNDLYCDAAKCAKEGSKSSELYQIAKEALHKALDEVVLSSKNFREQQNQQICATSIKRPIKKFAKAKDSSGKNLKRSASKNPLMESDDIR